MARINNVPTIIMKAIVTITNQETIVTVSGITIAIKTEEMQEGVQTLINFLKAVVPEDCKADMLNDMSKVTKVIELLARYRSCYQFNNGGECVQTITLNDNGTIDLHWDKCDVTVDFKEMMAVIKEFSELKSSDYSDNDYAGDREVGEPDRIFIDHDCTYNDLIEQIKDTGCLDVIHPDIIDYVSDLGNETGSKDNEIKQAHFERINNRIEQFNLKIVYSVFTEA